MRHSADNAIGESLSRSSGKMELHIRWMKKNCRWSCHMWILTNRGQREKGHWQIFLNGQQGIWRRTPCLVMPVLPGIFFVTWIRIMKKNFVIVKQVITGTRWTYTSAAPNMPWDIYCTAACGRSFYLISD